MLQVQALQYGPPEVLQIVKVEMPEIERRELLVQVKYASANPKDVLIRKGKLKSYLNLHFPLTFGQDFSGVIVKTGSQAGLYKPGDRVFGMVNQSTNGTLSEYIHITPNELYYAPENLTFAEAAAVPLTALTALQALRDIAKLKPGERVLINGASSGVGTFAIQIPKILGAHVTAVSSAKNHAFCRSQGADEVIDYQQTPVTSVPGVFDVFFDVFGNQRSDTVRHLLAKNGWYVTTVPNARSLWETVLSLFKLKKSRLVVVESHSEDLQQLKEWIEGGHLRPVVQAEFPMARIAEVHRRIETKRTVGKIVVKVSD